MNPLAIDKHQVADWLLRVATPAYLTAVDRNLHAVQLRELPAVTAEDLENTRRLRGVLKVLNPICDELLEIGRIEHNAALQTGNADPVFFGVLSALDFKKSLFPNLVEAGAYARAAFLPSRVGWIAYRIMMQSVTLALVRSNGQLTSGLEAVYETVMQDLQERGQVTT